jgi:hypothetical protein
MNEPIITVPAVVMLLLEGIKWVIRFFKKDQGFDFSEKFYVFMLAVLPLGVQPLLVWLGILPPDAGIDLSWQYAVQVVLQALLAVVFYNNSLKPLKEYARARKLLA